jgi:hypothetical protein
VNSVIRRVCSTILTLCDIVPFLYNNVYILHVFTFYYTDDDTQCINVTLHDFSTQLYNFIIFLRGSWSLDNGQILTETCRGLTFNDTLKGVNNFCRWSLLLSLLEVFRHVEEGGDVEWRRTVGREMKQVTASVERVDPWEAHWVDEGGETWTGVSIRGNHAWC